MHTKSQKSMHTKKRCQGSSEEQTEDQLLQNSELTDKQRLFCIYYVKYFNATKAYQKAYDCNYESAMVGGSKLLSKAKIKEEILQLKQNRLNKELLSAEDIFQKYMDIAFADINDYIDVKGSKITAKQEFDGTLVSEISNIKGATRVKLSDRMKALQWLSEHVGMATPEQKARLELLNMQKEQLKQNDEPSEDDNRVNNIADIIKQIVPVKESEIDE